MKCLRAFGIDSAARTRPIKTNPITAGMKAVLLFEKVNLSFGFKLGSEAIFSQLLDSSVTGPGFPAEFMYTSLSLDEFTSIVLQSTGSTTSAVPALA